MLAFVLIVASSEPLAMQKELPSVGPARGVAVSSVTVPSSARFVDAAGRSRILYVHEGAGTIHVGRSEFKISAELALLIPKDMVATLATTEAMTLVRFEVEGDPVKQALLAHKEDMLPLASGFARAQTYFKAQPFRLLLVDTTDSAIVRMFSSEQGGETVVPLSGQVKVRREGDSQAREPFTAFVAEPNVAHRIQTFGTTRWLMLASAHTMAMLERDRAQALASGFLGVMADGPLDAYDIKPIVETNGAALSACYKEALGEDRYFAGELRAHFVVKPNGSVHDVKVEHASIGNLPVQRCIAKVLGTMEFPKSKTKTVVSYPFVFAP
jgi:hypothetical protein